MISSKISRHTSRLADDSSGRCSILKQGYKYQANALAAVTVRSCTIQHRRWTQAKAFNG